MKRVVSVMLVIAAVIHLLPLSGAISNDRLSVLYGLSFAEPNIEILMRHRAVLFGLLGIFLLYSAFNSSKHLVGLAVGIISVVSFLYFAWSVGNYNAEIARVFYADLVALLCLLVGLVLHLLQGNGDVK